MREKTFISSALSGFCAQPSRPRSEICATMSPCEFRTKEAQNARKSPKTAHLCSALPSIVICVAAQCRHAYSCNKIRQSPNSIISLQIAAFCVLWLGWRTRSLSFFSRHTGLSWGLHGDIYGRKEEGFNGLCPLSFLCQIAITISQQPRWMSLFP